MSLDALRSGAGIDIGHSVVEVNGAPMRVAEAGSGPLVVLLHGFPAFSLAWQAQLVGLSAAGFRVIAPDMRGYNLSSKPRGIGAYEVHLLARDVAGLIEQFGAERAHVVGHDWGGGVAWAFAMLHPHRLERLVIINAPHPVTFVRHLARLGQLRKSWYMFFFQLPWLPEAALRANNFAAVRRELPEQAYVDALRRPGALTATINYYRAMFRSGPRGLRDMRRVIRAPTLVIWGNEDRFLGPELAEPDRRLVPDARVERLLGVGHWPQMEAQERVHAMLIHFLKQEPEMVGSRAGLNSA
jgi:pimeloyl-ACP methyl ester carboxylesterase